MKTLLIIILVGGLWAGCGKKENGDAGKSSAANPPEAETPKPPPVQPKVEEKPKPSPPAIKPKPLPSEEVAPLSAKRSEIIEKAIRMELKKPTGELTKEDLKKVRSLDFEGTGITDARLKEISKLQQLSSLNLTACRQITDEGLKEVAKLQQLSVLLLSINNKITDAGLKEVAKLQRLSELSLWETNITDKGLKEIVKLKQLSDLNLLGTKITDAGLKEVAKLQKLKMLGLGSQITDAGLKEVARLTQLKTLFWMAPK